MQNKKGAQFVVTGAIVAAAYASLTYLSNAFGLAYGPIQLRLSEALTVLAAFSPSCIWGLTVGCFISNIGSFNALDMLFGTLATLIAAWLGYGLRNIKFKKLPVITLLLPIIVNALVIGVEIALFYLPQGAGIYGFLISAGEVGIGEAIVVTVFGIPTYFAAEKVLSAKN